MKFILFFLSFFALSQSSFSEIDYGWYKTYDLAAREDFLTVEKEKPLERKVYENQFFDLIEQLYNATGVTNQVTPKLGFPEIQSLIETVQATDPMGAVNYSLKLLSIDAALKRYDLLWWDDAIEHIITEE